MESCIAAAAVCTVHTLSQVHVADPRKKLEA